MRAALATGARDEAVAAAAGPSDTGTAGSAENLDVSTSVLLTRQVGVLDGQLADAGSLLRLAGWWCRVAGVAVAVLGWRGVGRRLAEYR